MDQARAKGVSARTGPHPALLLLPLALLAAGRFLPGPAAWGFNHLAYLPGSIFGIWLAAALLLGLLLLPPVRRVSCGWMASALPRFLFERQWVPWLLAVVAGLLFLILRERSFFMGDGYLIGELVQRGVPFRAFDNLDYLLHFQVYKRLGEDGARFSSFDLYRGTSILVGMAAVALWLRLLGRLSWSPWRKGAVAGLLFFAGPAALFFGYVESYTFLYLFLTAFLISGLLVLEGRVPLWGAATFFGLALAFHLTALFTAPALLVLAWRVPIRSRRRRILEALVPPLSLFLLALVLHLAEGFNASWFRHEFLETQNTKKIWVSWTGTHGFFSALHWKDLFNLAMITAPVCLLILFSGVRRLRALAGEPRGLFLLVQVASLAVMSLGVDRKLGGARDWDLLSAHTAGLILLAGLLLPGAEAAETPAGATPVPPPAKGRGRKGESALRPVRTPVETPRAVVPLAIGVSLLVTAPWITLLHWEDRSILRFVDVAADFPDFPRGYAYEEVGKYYRKAGDLERAQPLYEKAVATNPSHARIRILLGSIYFARDNYDAAEQQYLAALRIDPDNYMAVEMLGKVATQREQYAQAWDWFRKLVELRPQDATSWQEYGLAAMHAEHWEEVITGMHKAIALDSSKRIYRQEIGIAQARAGRLDEAARTFQEMLQDSEPRPETRMALAWTRLEMARQAAAQGQSYPRAWLDEAEAQLKMVQQARPGDPQAADLMQLLEHLRL